MTPRTRSYRTKEILAVQKLLATGETLNLTGLASLPDEVYLEIVSHMPAMPVPTPTSQFEVIEILDRHQTLAALSQTCHSLRQVFLCYLWQRIEVYDGMKTHKGNLSIVRRQGNLPLMRRRRNPKVTNDARYKGHAEELIRQLEVVTVRDPSLAQYVNIMNIVVRNYSIETVLPELTRCIALFPNLHTAQIHFDFDFTYHHTLLRTTFLRRYSYPQIRNLILSPTASQFIPACPELKCLSPHPHSLWYDFGGIGGPSIEILGLLQFPSKDALNASVTRFPSLRDLTFDRVALSYGCEILWPLSLFHQLETVRLRLDLTNSGRWWVQSSLEDINLWAKAACMALADGPQKERQKRVIVTHQDGMNELFLVEGAE